MLVVIIIIIVIVIIIIIVIVTAIVFVIKLKCCEKVANDSMYATPLRSKAFYKEAGGNITKLEVFLQVDRIVATSSPLRQEIIFKL